MSRPLPAPQPDLNSRLLAAVAERDQPQAARLGQQWVHRRGLDALDRFLLTELVPSQGLEAAQWLRSQLGLAEASPAVAVALASASLTSCPDPAPVPAASAEEPSVGPRPALFGRLKARVRQYLEEVIVGSDDQENSGMPEPITPPVASLASDARSGGAGSATPAPAPASLAALRAWLPDGEEDGRDLPRAC